MGAFQSGFQLGQSAYHQAERNRLLQAQEERAAKEFGWREQEQARKVKLQADEDAAFEQLNLASTGMTPQVQQQVTQTYGLTPQQMAQAGGGEALKAKLAGYDQPDAHELQNVPAAGLQRTFTADQFKPQAANPVDVERAMGRVALAKRDMAGFRASNTAAVDLEEAGILKTAIKEYDGSDDQIGPTARFLNNNSKRITMGHPDKNGIVRVSLVNPDGPAEFLKLSRQEQALLYGAGKLWETNPLKAIQVMEGVNKNLAAAIAAENSQVASVTSTNNDATAKSHKMSVDWAELGIKQQNANTNERYRRDLAAAKGDSTAVDAFQRDIDGVLEGYQAAMAAGKPDAAAIYAREYDQLRALTPKGLRTPPALSALNNAQKAQGQTKQFEKLPEPGTLVTDSQGNRLRYSESGYPILAGGADPENFGKVSAANGVDQNMLDFGRSNGLVRVHEYGRHLVLGDKAYDISSKADVKAFNDAMRKLANEALAEEERIKAQRYPQLGLADASALAAEKNRSVLANIRQNTR